jgi:Do/DeqQ family serine protease
MKQVTTMIFAGMLGGAVTLAGLGLYNYLSKDDIPASALPARQVNFVNSKPGSASVPFDFTQAASAAMPAVVHIKATAKPTTANKNLSDSPFRFFFDDDFLFGQPGPQSGTGSGVIYSTDGYIITNNHVVEMADELEVTLYDNRTFDAKVIGTDKKTDLAIIKIEASNLPTLPLANSDEARVGEWVLAVGNPFDLTSTVTAGIISAKGRNIQLLESRDAIESFIQTDAAVNPGNSGGALVDAQGRLLGINTAIASRNGSFQGYSFAIPINLATRIVDDIIEFGSYQRPLLGVNISELDSDAAKDMGISISQGVLIESLTDGGSAQYAGLQPKDVIVGVNGRDIKTVPELQEAVGRAKVGDVLNVKVNRKGDVQNIPVRLKAAQ